MLKVSKTGASENCMAFCEKNELVGKFHFLAGSMLHFTLALVIFRLCFQMPYLDEYLIYHIWMAEFAFWF